MSQERQQPFKSDYAKGLSTSAVGKEEGVPAVVLPAYVGGTETPVIGKPHGNGKPYRLRIRGKISRE
jgi:hypothetical protein